MVFIMVAVGVSLIAGLVIGACLGAIAHEAANHGMVNALHRKLAIAQNERDAATARAGKARAERVPAARVSGENT